DVELPNQEVRQAFTAVTDARETKNTKLNEAQKYRNQKISEAQGEIDAIISIAEGEKTSRIQQAEGDVAVFNGLYAQYSLNKDITKSRLILETLEQSLFGNGNNKKKKNDEEAKEVKEAKIINDNKKPTNFKHL
ncbi:hypothetical protein RhiirA1_405790, partial [Rhizophagus irregularis]